MDILAIILACSLHADDILVRTLIDEQSNNNIYFVGDLNTLKTNDSLKSPAAALTFAEDLRRHGGRPAVGLLGVPLEWAMRFGRAPIELFDACANIAVGTAALAEYDDRCAPMSARGHRRPPTIVHGRARALAFKKRRTCVLSLFARDLGVVGAPARLLRRIVHGPDNITAASSDAPAALSPVFGAEASDAAPDGSVPDRPHLFLNNPAGAVPKR